MHFFYLDEAGCTGNDLGNAQQPVFVLGGVSVRDEGWYETTNRFHAVIRDYFQGNVPDGFELHAEELLSPNGDGAFAGHDRQRRNALALCLLDLLAERSHHVHLIGIDKQKINEFQCNAPVPFNRNSPYLLAFDYMITYINWDVKEKLGRSARGMIILDDKDQFEDEIELITHDRRFKVPAAHRIKWIVEFSYPVDSRKNPMVQLSDLVVFCAKKFLEIEGGYKPNLPVEAKTFFARCFSKINDRIKSKSIIERQGRNMDALNTYLQNVRIQPTRQWKRRYGL